MPIGVVTGLKAEAACFGHTEAGLQVLCLGPGLARAGQAADRLVHHRVKGLVSFGVSGGLAPYLEPGDMILGTGIRGPDEHVIPTDRIWTARLNHAMAGLGFRPHCGRLLAVERPVLLPAEKRRQFETTGALAVDMESYAVAQVAAKRGLPFACLRVVADPSGITIPGWALAGLGRDGSVRSLPVIARLAREPWRLPTLLQLSAAHAASLKVLRTAAPAVLSAGSPPFVRV